jgi:glycyl-radical enzyme activating protein
MASRDPLVFSVQHFCLHDGPGIRSLVFFKGCPLRCPWCQNVESWKAEAEMAFKPLLCIGCRACVDRCRQQAMAAPGRRDAARCTACAACADACPSGALLRFGASRSAEEIVEELRPEFPLFRTSGGGVTFTGGEPALYPEFCAGLAGMLRAEGIGVALETCGLFDLQRLWPLLHELQLVFFDIKIFDRADHKRICGADNRVITQNLASLVAAMERQDAPALWPRLPLVPGMTDTRDNIEGWASFLSELGLSFVTIVPYHPMGAGKRTWLGLPDSPELRIPTAEDLEAVEELFAARGIRVFAPGEEHIQLTASERKNAAAPPPVEGQPRMA